MAGRMTLISVSLAFVSLAFHSCDLAEENVTVPVGTVRELYVAGFGHETRTSLDDGLKVSWDAGDRIWYFSGNTSSAMSGVKTSNAAKSGQSSEFELERALEDNWFNAVYMGDREVSFVSRDSASFSFNGVDSEQDGSFRNANVCAASFGPSDRCMTFHNVTALLKFSLSGDNVRKIVFEGASDEVLAGDVTVDMTRVHPQASLLSGGERSITLTVNGRGTYYVNVIPQVLSRGFKMTFCDGSGTKIHTVTGVKPLTLAGGVITNLGRLNDRFEAVVTEASLFTPENWARCDEVLEEYLECGRTANKTSICAYADGLLGTQRADGSWPDVDYGDRGAASWSPSTHAGYFRDLARAWHMSGDARYLDACRKAMSFWVSRNPISSNWWYNEIGAPRVFAPALLLLRNVFTENELAAADRILSKTRLGMTAQNKLWAAGIVLQRGLLRHDVEMVKEAREDMAEELRISEDEGIQPDYSFHQHGRVMQTGVYGLSFAHDYAWWINAFEGTTLQFAKARCDVLVDYLLKCQTWLIKGGRYDLNACGRQVGQGVQKDKADMVTAVLKMLGLKDNVPVGAMYPYSDFGVYRSKNWCASIRMQSNRLRGWEDTNQEDIQGYFSSDGALLVRRTGGEYNDITACWDWKHIPGTTTYDDGKPLWGSPTNFPFNKTDLVSGKVFGDSVMVAAMDLVRDGLTARKAWFFYPRGIVCLGAGITMDRDYEVTTTLEQNLFVGTKKSGNCITNAGIAYYLIDGGTMNSKEESRTKRWNCLCPSYSSSTVTKTVFDLSISHGKSPRDASYAYVVSPEGLSPSAAAAQIDADVRIVSNTKDVQSVSISGKTYTIDWRTASIF